MGGRGEQPGDSTVRPASRGRRGQGWALAAPGIRVGDGVEPANSLGLRTEEIRGWDWLMTNDHEQQGGPLEAGPESCIIPPAS